MTDEPNKKRPTLGKGIAEQIRNALRLDEVDTDRWGGVAESLRSAGSVSIEPAVIEWPEPDPDLVNQPANIARLVAINEESRAQLLGLAEITGAALAESRALRRTIMDTAEEQDRATAWVFRGELPQRPTRPVPLAQQTTSDYRAPTRGRPAPVAFPERSPYQVRTVP